MQDLSQGTTVALTASHDDKDQRDQRIFRDVRGNFLNLGFAFGSSVIDGTLLEGSDTPPCIESGLFAMMRRSLGHAVFRGRD